MDGFACWVCITAWKSSMAITKCWTAISGSHHSASPSEVFWASRSISARSCCSSLTFLRRACSCTRSVPFDVHHWTFGPMLFFSPWSSAERMEAWHPTRLQHSHVDTMPTVQTFRPQPILQHLLLNQTGSGTKFVVPSNLGGLTLMRSGLLGLPVVVRSGCIPSLALWVQLRECEMEAGIEVIGESVRFPSCSYWGDMSCIASHCAAIWAFMWADITCISMRKLLMSASTVLRAPLCSCSLPQPPAVLPQPSASVVRNSPCWCSPCSSSEVGLSLLVPFHHLKTSMQPAVTQLKSSPIPSIQTSHSWHQWNTLVWIEGMGNYYWFSFLFRNGIK